MAMSSNDNKDKEDKVTDETLTENPITESGKTRKIKPQPTNVQGVAITAPPSMVILTYDMAGNPAGQIELAPGHVSLDRMDLVFVAPDGKVAALKGEEVRDAGELPKPPATPPGCQALANVYIKAGATSLDEFSVNPPIMGGTYELNPRDEFEALLLEIVDLHRRKNADYANEANIYANFDLNSAQMGLAGYTPLEDCKSMVLRKLGRINNLRGRDPQNETVTDSFRDLAGYSLLMYGLHLRDGE